MVSIARNSESRDASENIVAGIGWMLVTMFLFTTMDAFAKYLTADYSVTQIVWARFFFHMIWLSVFFRSATLSFMRSHRTGLQLLRSVLLVGTTGLFFSGLSTTPLSTATTIMFLSPLFVTVLAIPLLAEKVGIRRWIGVLVGFTGALIVVRPDTSGVAIGHILLICAAMTNALYQILTRKVRLYDKEATSLFYSGLVGVVVCSVLVPGSWAPPSTSVWLIFIVIGFLGCASHLCLIRAFRCAPASVVTPFSYSALLWSGIYGFVLFENLPDRWTLMGATLIVGSGLYIFFREVALGKTLPPETEK